jgi:hypothetical protein
MPNPTTIAALDSEVQFDDLKASLIRKVREDLDFLKPLSRTQAVADLLRHIPVEVLREYLGDSAAN